jgi:hypothetical protein
MEDLDHVKQHGGDVQLKMQIMSQMSAARCVATDDPRLKGK